METLYSTKIEYSRIRGTQQFYLQLREPEAIMTNEGITSVFFTIEDGERLQNASANRQRIAGEYWPFLVVKSGEIIELRVSVSLEKEVFLGHALLQCFAGKGEFEGTARYMFVNNLDIELVSCWHLTHNPLAAE